MYGVRVVAIFEFFKAVLVLIVGCGLLSLINRDAEEYAVYFVRHLHLNPASKFPHIFLETVRHLTNTQLWMFAALAFADAMLRCAVAYGLWKELRWAEWLGVVAAGIYIPIEIYEMALHLTWLKSATFVTNVLIVIYLGYVLYHTDHKARENKAAIESNQANFTS
jgi:uncharacterized membrane protein (DUF2068 family)